MIKILTAAAAVLLCVAPLRAQTGGEIPPSQQSTPTSTPPADSQPASLQSEVRLQGLYFGNFFQAENGTPSEDATAIGAGYRAIYRPRGWKTDVYGDVSLMKFTNLDRPNPNGLRVGAKHDGSVHAFEIFADRAGHRAAFDVGTRTAIATVTTLSGEYSYKIGPRWQVGAEALRERQRFDVESDQENDYTRAAVSVRYRGFGSMFSPRVGYAIGDRDVPRSPAEGYDEHYWFIGATSAPNSRTYLSLTYRDRYRDYDPALAAVGSAFSRRDARPQISGFAAWRISKSLSSNLYFSRDVSRSSLPWRNFRTSFVLLGLTAHL